MKNSINFNELDKIIDKYKDDPVQRDGILVLKSSTKAAFRGKEIPRRICERIMTTNKSSAEVLASTFLEDDEEALFEAFMQKAESYGNTIKIVFADEDDE